MFFIAKLLEIVGVFNNITNDLDQTNEDTWLVWGKIDFKYGNMDNITRRHKMVLRFQTIC